MDKLFPTFGRWLHDYGPFPITRPWGRKWAQRRTLMRLIVTATEENTPLVPLIEAWAEDESGRQQGRLQQLAKLLKQGTPLSDAVEEVRGVLGDEEILAVRFGSQSGTLAATLRDSLSQSDPAKFSRSPRRRQLLAYLAIYLVVGALVGTFFQVKIVPELEKIFEEFSIQPPAALQWSVYFSKLLTEYWFVVVLAAIGVWWLVFTSWPGRVLRRGPIGSWLRPLRELRVADVLEKLSVASEAGRPVAAALSTLARYHYDPKLRNQLLFVRNEMEQGADVWQSMSELHLLTAPEARALELSEQLGNRPWVLKQLAYVKKERTQRRAARWSELLLPAVVLLMGAFVLFQALSIFGALIDLVFSLL